MANIYANENFPLPVIEELRLLGHDVLTSFEAGNAGQAIPDDKVLAYAIEQERVLITLNRKHFIRLHNENSAHKGIIVCTVDPDFAAQAQRIHSTLQIIPKWMGSLFA